MSRKKTAFFSKKISIVEWEFDLLIIIALFLGTIVGVYLMLFDVFPQTEAAASPWTQTDWSGGTASGTVSSTVTTYESLSDLETSGGALSLPLNDQYAVMKGNQLSTGATDLGVTSLTAVQYNSSQTYNDAYFSYAGGDPTRITVDQDADYFVSLTFPIITDEVDDGNRSGLKTEIHVNGVKADVGRAQSSYIRSASNHHESSNNMAVLLEDLSEDDYIEVFVIRNTTYTGRPLMSNFTVYVEPVLSGETIFNATATRTVGSTNLNSSVSELQWTEGREDTGYTHDNSTNSHEVTIDEAGAYFVTVNVPFGGSVSRGNIIGQVLLDSTQVEGAEFKQGYVRNGSGHVDSSIHWAGVIETTTSDQTLTVSLQQEAASGTLTIDGEKATLFIQKLPTAGVYYGKATQVGNSDDWNPGTPTDINWATDDILDTNTYTHSTSTDNHLVTVDSDGDYLVAFNMSHISSRTRSNPKVTILVNDTPLSDTETKSNYVRNSSGHNEASTSLLYMLTGLSANDTISVQVEAEGATGSVNDDEPATLMIWNKGYKSTGSLDSNIFDAEFPADWGTVSYTTGGTGTVTFKARSDSNSDMSTASAWGTCSNISSGSTLSDSSCIDNLDQYFQYQITLTSPGPTTPTFQDLTVNFAPSDSVPPDTNASDLEVYDEAGGTELVSNDWVMDDPYATWTIGDDDASGDGLRGYCVYIGTDAGADPASTGGLLNSSNSPEPLTNTTCGFIVSEPDSGSTVTFDLDNDTFHDSPWMTSSTSPYYIHIKAVDIAGNVYGGSSESFQFRFDNTGPENPAGMSAPQEFQREITAFTVTWATSGGSAASDAHSGVKGYQYRIAASGTWYGASHTGTEDCDDVLTVGTYTLDELYDSLDQGDNIFYLRTIDNACNISDTNVTAILKYNADAPSAPQNLTAVPESNTVNAFAFEWDVPETFQGSPSGLSYCYTVNVQPSAVNCSFTNSTSLDEDAYATQPENNTLYVVTRDEASNINYLDYASVIFNAQTTAPGIPRNADVSDVSIKTTENWKLAVSWDVPEEFADLSTEELLEADLPTYRIYRAQGDLSCSSTFSSFEEVGFVNGTTYVDTGLTQQDYSYCVKACDSANNCSAVSSSATGFPDGKFTEPAELISEPTVSNISTRKVTISWITARTSDTRIAFGEASGEYFDEEPSNSEQVTNHTINLNNLDPGTTYYYVARWTDEDGNIGQSNETTFTTAPAPIAKDVSVPTIGLTNAIIRFTTENASQVKIYYGLTAGFGGLEEIPTSTTESTYNAVLEGLQDGTQYSFKINTVDIDGNEYDGTILNFTTLPRPQITNVRLQQVVGTAQPTVLVSWESNTDVTSVVTYYPENNQSASIDNIDIERKTEHTALITGLLAQTTYNLVVKGQDQQGNEATSDIQRFTTSSDTRPPRVTNLTVETAISENANGDPLAQVIVSWDTDELATSQVEYGEGTGTSYASQTAEDTNLTFNHTVLISNLTPSKVYHLRALATDEAGNVGTSIDNVTITPKASDNAFDLVIGNLQEIFGFLRSL